MISEGPRRARKEEGPEVGRKRAGDFADEIKPCYNSTCPKSVTVSATGGTENDLCRELS